MNSKTDYYDTLSHSRRYTISMPLSDNDPLVNAIVEQLERELATAAGASQEAHSSATHTENIADNKYDTLALEAAYLAHGQSVRITELQETINLYKRFRRPEFNRDSSIQLGALVDIENEQGLVQRIFVGPAAGGHIIEGLNSCTQSTAKQPLSIRVVTASSPMGRAMLNHYVDDEFTLTIQKRTECFTVINLQ